MELTRNPLNESMTHEVIDKSIGLLETKCIRLNGRKPEWRTLFSEQEEGIRRSTSAAELEDHINRVLSRGGLSHVAFFHGTAQRVPARYAINATFCEFESAEGARWMFQDVHEGGPAHAAGVRPGDVLLEANGLVIRPPELPTFALGIDHTLAIEDASGSVRHVQIVLPKARDGGKAGAKPPMAEPISVTSRVLKPRIGYARIAFFPGVNGQRFARELDRSLSQLVESDRLVIDLRGNLGGFVGSLRLMSYLTPDRVSVGYSLTRRGEDRHWRPEQLACIDKLPATTFDRLKMAVRFMILHRDRSIRLMTEGLGPKPFHGRIVILVNEHTLSAGEMVAAFAKENRLATIVGSRTGGQVLGGANFSVGHGFTIRFPAAGWYTWRGAVVEGQGVTPDVEVPLSKEDLRFGRDNQLEAAITEAEGLSAAVHSA